MTPLLCIQFILLATSSMVKSDPVHGVTCYTDNENSCAAPEDETTLLQTHARVYSTPENSESTLKDVNVVSGDTPPPEDENYDPRKLSEEIFDEVAETLGPTKIAEVLILIENFLTSKDGPRSRQALLALNKREISHSHRDLELEGISNSTTPSSMVDSMGSETVNISLMAKLFDKLFDRHAGTTTAGEKVGYHGRKMTYRKALSSGEWFHWSEDKYKKCKKDCDRDSWWPAACKANCWYWYQNW